ncbi:MULTISPECIES: YozE family protein [unclassified Lactobacillus]|uniref:YozE family protein n=1 Tax=unclassified Lactobacillus TaxID=2620435 RepID=UPI000EFD736E|nr:MULTISPECIES: YozE family protein [unclassified Lactobacillus]RMC25174.1 YozE family protein [Lactobacillus sp. ESL0247]RMC29328.1 YozE family protein [Lactobacillus sp. ESL0246]RMC32349.1 YozE family protein [Lactobacillus sp. ESL0245]RMC48765.1 YozE family protein [Lactobacillus sp. ESL0228]
MVYRESFYRYLMTQRNNNSSSEIAQFANNAQNDQTFPKQEQDYEKLSNYLELNAGYLSSMSIFDDAYQMYRDKMSY